MWDTLLGDEVLFLPLLLLATIVFFELFENCVFENCALNIEASELAEFLECGALWCLNCEELSAESPDKE